VGTTSPWTRSLEQGGEINPGSENYSDGLISAKFYLVKSSNHAGVSGFSQYTSYHGIGFSIVNKTNLPLTIDWNRVSYIDTNGNSGNCVMHTGLKYNECSNEKAPSVIPPHGRMSDVITPCRYLKFLDGNCGNGIYLEPRWVVDGMLPNPEYYSTVTFGVFMPLKIGEKTYNYTFMFSGTREHG
jgi:hypothetical protein